MSRNTSKTSLVGTVAVSIIAIVLLLAFLIWTWFFLATTAGTSSNDGGLELLRIFGAFASLWIFGPLSLFCAIMSFKYSFDESRRQFVDDSQVTRFIIIGVAFVVAAIMFFLFGLLIPKFVMLH